MSSLDLLLTALASAGGTVVVLGGLASWLGKVWADRIAQYTKLVGEIDLDLRKLRIQAYSALWKSTSILPKWPRAETVTYADLYAFSGNLRDWYYGTGGMYLSRSTHNDAYTPLQDAITDLLKAKKSGPLSETDYEAIRERCSALRTALASDIESRREGPL